MDHSRTLTFGLWRPFWRFLMILGFFNFAWESAQLPLYTIWRNGSSKDIGFAVVHCTAGDLLIALICAVASLALLGWQWPIKTREKALFLALFTLFSLTYTIFSEWFNTTVRTSWEYSPLMPVVPPLNTGISPLLQWLTMPFLAFWLEGRKTPTR